MELHNAHIILTGAASGIGAELLAKLAVYQADIIAVDIDAGALDQQVQELREKPARIHPFVGDLCLPETLDTLFAFAEGRGLRPTIFVANAGFAYYETFDYADWGRMERMMRLNVLSPLYALAKMQALHRATQSPYYVLMTASAMAKLSLPGYALYSASKGALSRFEDAYRFEVRDKGRIGLVYPIATRTNFFKAAHASDTPVPFPSQPAERVAAAMLRGIRRNSRAIYPSRLFWVLRFPQALYEWMNYPYQWYYARVLQEWKKRKA
jgi:short-subunit dehydrogenase